MLSSLSADPKFYSPLTLMRCPCLAEEGSIPVWLPGPEASSLPGSPLSPLIPLSPGAPLSPLSPGGPLEPGAPGGPAGPAGPGIQEDLTKPYVYFSAFSPHCTQFIFIPDVFFPHTQTPLRNQVQARCVHSCPQHLASNSVCVQRTKTPHGLKHPSPYVGLVPGALHPPSLEADCLHRPVLT